MAKVGRLLQKLREFHCGQKPLSDGLAVTRKFFYMISKGLFLQKYLSDSMTAISSHRTAVFIGYLSTVHPSRAYIVKSLYPPQVPVGEWEQGAVHASFQEKV